MDMSSGSLLRRSLSIAAVLAVCILMVALVIGWFFSNLILQPGRAKELRSAWAKTAINLQLRDWVETHGGTHFRIPTSRGYELAACFVPSPEAERRTAVLVHGFGDRKEKMLPYAFLMRSLGYNVLLYDHRNCGESGGNTSTMGYFERQDLTEVMRVAREKTGRGAKLVVLGVSMGAATALLQAGSGDDPEPNLVIADCGFSDFRREALHRLAGDYPTVPGWSHPLVVQLGFLVARLRSGAVLGDVTPGQSVGRIKAPVLFLTTAEDDFVPANMTSELHTATKSPKALKIFPTGGHSDALDLHPAQYRETVMGFLKENGLYEPGPPFVLTE